MSLQPVRQGPIRFVVARDHDDRLAHRAAVDWAIGQLRTALEHKGAQVDVLDGAPGDDRPGDALILAGHDSRRGRQILDRAGVSIPRVPEGLGLVPGESEGRFVLLVGGWDERGVVYALLELADRVEHSTDPVRAVRLEEPVLERPANALRSVARCFASEIHDTPWFHDEAFWRRYLSMVIAERFNRVNLMVGLGYNFPLHVTDAYLYFAYPFLVDVPGSGVRIPQLPEEERARNLAMLRFASDEAVRLGLDFQLGLWTHAYEWIDSPDARHTVEGLASDRHAAYCRDALQALLQACPGIGGLTIRTHGESGIPERSWDFWRTVFDGVVRSGRRVGLDLHAKGLDQRTLEIALATGLPVTVSPKYAAEHMGLPYHQAAIRELDRPPTEREGRAGKARYMTVSEGSRPFTRYSYGDFLREDRPYDVVFRIWPGTQRLLLWADPAMAAGFGRRAGLAGSQGLEWCEPLSLKGRQGTALAGSRDGYADAALSPLDDWEKYAYTFRLFGRLTYDPDSEPETWRRSLRTTFGTAAEPAEAALATASRILPLVTTAHHPSASNNYYWPEIYTDIGIVGRGGSVETHYYDTPAPKRFGTVGPLDPEMFSSAEETVREILAGRRSGRYSPLDVASWLDRLCDEAREHLARMERELPAPSAPEARRLIVDVAIQEAIGRFFAGKLGAALLYELFERTSDAPLLDEALDAYRSARAAWADAAERASGVYVDDLTFGPQPWLRGTWSDRLPSIDRDLEAMSAVRWATGGRSDVRDGGAGQLVVRAAQEQRGPQVSHEQPPSFRRGQPLDLFFVVDAAAADAVEAVGLRYRQLDQSRAYTEIEMQGEGGRFVATIPGDASDSPFALQYFFVVRDARGGAWIHPGLDPELSNQPYYLVRQPPGSGNRLDPGERSCRS